MKSKAFEYLLIFLFELLKLVIGVIAAVILVFFIALLLIELVIPILIYIIDLYT